MAVRARRSPLNQTAGPSRIRIEDQPGETDRVNTAPEQDEGSRAAGDVIRTYVEIGPIGDPFLDGRGKQRRGQRFGIERKSKYGEGARGVWPGDDFGGFLPGASYAASRGRKSDDRDGVNAHKVMKSVD